MNKTTFLQEWKIRHNGKLSPLNEGEEFLYAAKGSAYVRVGCPYCIAKGKGEDKNHHLNAHFEQEWFKCVRCGTGGSISFLLGRRPPKEKPWTTYVSRPENHRPHQALIARSMGIESSRCKPGACCPMDALRRSHPAWQYLMAEGFTVHDIERICETYGVHYCIQGISMTENPENTTTGRLIFEIQEGGILYGWQARWLPESWPPKEEDKAKAKRVEKYLFSPGFRKSHILYNWDAAQAYDTWAVVEGAKKVWKAGPYALASFGIGNSPHPPADAAGEAYEKHWAVRLAKSGRKIAIIYDKGAEEQASLHAAVIREMGGDATAATLPEHGPADLDNYMREEILQIVKKTCGRLPRRI